MKWNSNSLVSFSRYSLPLLRQCLLTATHPSTNLELHFAPRASNANRKCIKVGCGTNPRYVQILFPASFGHQYGRGFAAASFRAVAINANIVDEEQREHVILQFLQTAASSPRSEARRVSQTCRSKSQKPQLNLDGVPDLFTVSNLQIEKTNLN